MLCACGCGEKTKLAPVTNASKGWVKGEPLRFKKGHRLHTRLAPPNPSGLCQCGCGELAPVARSTDPRHGHVRGEPMKYIRGHRNRAKVPVAEPNPSGLCMCGCGRETPLARQTSSGHGWVKGKPVRFLPSHGVGLCAGLPFDSHRAEDHGYETPCWISVRAKDLQSRPQVGAAGDRGLIYRLVYEEAKGAIPVGWVIHHKCETPACVNPDHLEPMTREEHIDLHRDDLVAVGGR